MPIAILFALVGYFIGRSSAPTTTVRGVIPNRRSVVVGQQLPAPTPRITPLQAMAAILRNGRRPPVMLIHAAAQQAFDAGRWDLAQAILTAHENDQRRLAKPAQPDNEPDETNEASDGPDNDSDDDEPAETIKADVTSVETPAPAATLRESPIDDVDDESWSDFVTAMRFDEPKDRPFRLRAELAKKARTDDDRYDAFVADIKDTVDEERSMIDRYVGMPVKIRGTEHAVTMSGLLGVIKAAGAKNADHWIQHSDDHEKFPKTTELFLRCNGCF